MKEVKKYLDNDELLYETLLCQGKGIVSSKLAAYWVLMTNKISNKQCYNNIGHEIRVNIIADAYIALSDNFMKFDRRRTTNVFAFFTTVITNSIKQSYNFHWKGKKTTVNGRQRLIYLPEIGDQIHHL